MDKKIMKTTGFIMFFIGATLFLSNIRVTSFSFGNSKVTGLIMLLIAADFVLGMIRPNKIFLDILAILVLILVAIIFLNIRIFMYSTSFFRWVITIFLIFGGAGLTLKNNE